MDVVIYTRTRKHWYDLFAEGLKRHGVAVEFRSSDNYRPCDLAVFWAHKSHNVIAGQQRIGADYLVLERGYFGNRFAMTSLGFNGLNGRAEFHNQDMPDDRWRKHAVPVLDWQNRSGPIVIMGQVHGDAALAMCPDFDIWVADTAKRLQQLTGKEVKFRGHPSARGYRHGVPGIAGDLDQVLAKASLVVTWNSNSGVDAALAGVPVVAVDAGAMARPVASHTLEAPVITPDRQSWLNGLAYCQWTENEIARGDAWAHLSRRYS